MDTHDKKIRKFLKYNKNIRDSKKIQSDDEAIIVTLDKIPEEVACILFLLKLPKLQYLTTVQESLLKQASYGIEDFEYNINIDK